MMRTASFDVNDKDITDNLSDLYYYPYDFEAAGEVVARFTKADEKEFLTRNIAIHPPALAVG